MNRSEPTMATMGWDRDLAKHLLTRHLQVSWPLREDPPHWMSSKPAAGISDGSWLDNDQPYEHLTRGDLRTVAVVGAGASRPLPMAEALIGELERQYISSTTERDAALERLDRLYGFDPTSFEARLAAISLTPESDATVRRTIAKRFNQRRPTLLQYEILAHLLKHRFLDAIISFNFDELLDQSLSDELGDSEFRHVVTERDCSDVQLNPTAGDYLPLYIKMHGTASEPETLRFTQEAYYWTPKRIVEAVECILDTDHCVILNLGYQMANFDFQYLLRRPRNLTLYHMDPYLLADSVKEKIQSYRTEERPAQGETGGVTFTNCAPEGWPERCAAAEDGVDDEPFLEQSLEPLIACLEEEAKAGPGTQRAHWRSIQRHRAVVELLRDSDLETDVHCVDYLRRRTIIELAFAATKGRGVVSIEPLIKDRPGRCFDEYCRRARAAGLSAQSWSMLCKAGGLVRGEDSPPDTYHVAAGVLKTSEDGEPAPPSRRDPWRIHRLQLIDPTKMARHVLTQLDPQRWPRDALSENHAEWPEAEKAARAFRTALDHLIRDTEVELHATDDRICSKVFERPRVLVTLTGMQGWTRRLLKDRKYTELWVSAESGDWLTEYQDIVRPGTSIKLIAAFAPQGEVAGNEATLVRPGGTPFGLEDEDPDTGVIRAFLPWYRHNRHMTILRRGNEPIAALHFARRLRTPLVTPVIVDSQADLLRVDLSFRLLWAEAISYMVQAPKNAASDRREGDRRTRDERWPDDRERRLNGERRLDERRRRVDRRGISDELAAQLAWLPEAIEERPPKHP